MEARQQVHLIICEGSSEVAYLQELNRLLREHEIPLVYGHTSCDGGQYSTVVRKYRETKKHNPRTKIHICIDYDIYLRNNNNNWTSYTRKPASIPDFYFTHMNFEDFLSLHLENNLSDTWYHLCASNHHFTSPMHAETYTPLFTTNIFPDYKKGEIPFTLTAGHLSSLFNNLNKVENPFSCGFGILLQQHLRECNGQELLT